MRRSLAVLIPDRRSLRNNPARARKPRSRLVATVAFRRTPAARTDPREVIRGWHFMTNRTAHVLSRRERHAQEVHDVPQVCEYLDNRLYYLRNGPGILNRKVVNA